MYFTLLLCEKSVVQQFILQGKDVYSIGYPSFIDFKKDSASRSWKISGTVGIEDRDGRVYDSRFRIYLFKTATQYIQGLVGMTRVLRSSRSHPCLKILTFSLRLVKALVILYRLFDIQHSLYREHNKICEDDGSTSVFTIPCQNSPTGTFRFPGVKWDRVGGSVR